MSDSIPGFPPEDAMATDSVVASVRRPPHSLESEQSILGGLMLDSNAFELVSDVLSADDFYRREHQIIYETIARLALSGKYPSLCGNCSRALDFASTDYSRG